jgi:acetyltransferase-like isoleucine patch superfamily enzyme
MIEKISNRLFWFIHIGYKYIFQKTVIKGAKNATIVVGRNVKMKNTMIDVTSGSFLSIEDNTSLNDVMLHVNGHAQIGKNNSIYGQTKKENIYIEINGSLSIGTNNRLQTCIRIRFGGKVEIGTYNNINSNSEIRCDEQVTIGDYNQISYNVMIWDTNTHNIYPANERRKLTRTKGIGYEFEKPKTKPIFIGNDCWIGKDVALLKGVSISNKCIVGFRSQLTDINLDEGTTIVPDNKYKIFKNNV